MGNIVIATLLTASEPIDVVLEDEQSSSMDTEESEPVAAAAYAAPTTYAGSAYYTPAHGGSFYAPWGTDSLDAGLNYFTLAVGAVSIVAVLVFAVPYAWDVLTTVIDEFKSNMGK